MHGSETPTIRSALALAFLAGFYVLGVALVLAGLGLIAWSVLGPDDVNPFGAGLGGIVSVLAARAVWMAKDDGSEVPGMALAPDAAPALERLVAQVAAHTGSRAPDEIRVSLDVNAHVLELGTALGLRKGTRVVVIGLGLLDLLPEAAVRAALAHELGHFEAGDTRVAPVTYAARAALVRALSSLQGRLLALPFELYGRLFLLGTGALSKHQERAADDAAAKAYGAEPLAAAIVGQAKGAVALAGFWQEDVAPLMLQNRFPERFLDGFRRYWAARHEGLEIGEGPAHPWDSHPSMTERLETLEVDVARADALIHGGPPASETLGIDVESIASDMVFGSRDTGPGAIARPIAWEAAADEVWGPLMATRRAAARGVAGAWLERDEVPDAREALAAIADRVAAEGIDAATDRLAAVYPFEPLAKGGLRVSALVDLTATLIADVMLSRGARWVVEVGAPLALKRADADVDLLWTRAHDAAERGAVALSDVCRTAAREEGEE